MKILIGFLSVGFAVMCVTAAPDAGLPVVVDGQARAVIVVNTAGGRVTALAAEELCKHIESMTGVKLPVVSAANWKSDTSTTALILGQGDLLNVVGVELGELPREGFRMVSVPAHRALVLAGRDIGDPLATRTPYLVWQEFGTLYAVYELLEQWDVRWLFPGELGTIIPKCTSLTAPLIDKTDAPDFTMRNHWPRGVTPDGNSVSRSDLKSDNPAQRSAARQAVLWALRNRAGNSENTYLGGHHSPRWWSLWSESHPEFIGLYRGQRGVRRSPPGAQPDKLIARSKLCVGHPNVAEAVAALAIQAFSKSPDRKGYSICEQDGSAGFCECPFCTALDPQPVAGEIVNPATASLTDRYMVFWNRVAEKVAAVFPDRSISAYLYTRSSDLPQREKKLHPALKVIFVFNGEVEPRELRRRIAGWSAISYNPIALYTHPMIGAWPVQDFSGSAFPALTLENVREGLVFCREQKVVGFITDGGHFADNTTGSHGVLGYAYARWLWDADRSAADILDDFTCHAFGPAAAIMCQAFESIAVRQAAFPRQDGEDAWLAHHLQVFSPEFADEILSSFDQAIKLAVDKADQQRVNIFRKNLIYTAAELELERSWRRFEVRETTIDPVLKAYRHCETVYAGLPPETRPQNPMFRKSNAARAMALAGQFQVLRVLPPITAWEVRADPYGEGVTDGWAMPGVAGDWRSVGARGYDMQGFWQSDLRVWYRLEFETPADKTSADRLFLSFQVNNTSADIFLNGDRIGQHILGESGFQEPELDGAGNLVLAQPNAGLADFTYAIGKSIRSGAVNTLAIRIWGYTDRGVACDRAWLLQRP